MKGYRQEIRCKKDLHSSLFFFLLKKNTNKKCNNLKRYETDPRSGLLFFMFLINFRSSWRLSRVLTQ